MGAKSFCFVLPVGGRGAVPSALAVSVADFVALFGGMADLADHSSLGKERVAEISRSSKALRGGSSDLVFGSADSYIGTCPAAIAGGNESIAGSASGKRRKDPRGGG